MSGVCLEQSAPAGGPVVAGCQAEGCGATECLAEVLDVSGDSWLGTTNNIRFLARGKDGRSGVALLKTGEVKLFQRAAKALKHGLRVGRVLACDEAVRSCREVAGLASHYRLNDLVAKANDALWAGKQAGERVGVIHLETMVKPEEVITKVVDERSKNFVYTHRPEGKPEEETGYTFWFKWNKPKSLVLLDEDQLTEWKADVLSRIQSSGLEEHEYVYSVGSINAQLLRIAAVLGSKAKAHPFDVEACCGSVVLGKFRIVLTQNSVDLIDVTVEYDGVVVSKREDLVSVTMEVEGTAGPMGRGATYNELGVAAYEAYLEAKLAKKLQRKPQHRVEAAA